MKQFSHCYVQVKLGDAISTFWEQLPEARGACERLYTLFPNLLQWTGLCAPLYFVGNFHLMIQMQMMMSTICAPTFVKPIRRSNQCLTPIGVNACSTRWIWRCSLASWVKRHGCSNIFSCVLSKSAHRATGCVCIAYPIATSSSHTPTFVGKILWRLLPKIPAHNVG